MSCDIYINFEEGVKRVVNNTGLYIKMIERFKDDVNIGDLELAMAEKDFQKAQTAAHALKGLAGNLSFTGLFNQTAELDAQLKNILLSPAREAEQGLAEKMSIVKNVYKETLDEIKKVAGKYDGIKR